MYKCDLVVYREILVHVKKRTCENNKCVRLTNKTYQRVFFAKYIFYFLYKCNEAKRDLAK